jgi:hypothetical protein
MCLNKLNHLRYCLGGENRK